MHFEHHDTCPVLDSCSWMGGNIVKKLMGPLLGEFCCICSVPCYGVEMFLGHVLTN